MIKRTIAGLSTIALIMSCDSTTLVSSHDTDTTSDLAYSDTLWVRDTITDTLYMELKSFIYDTVMIEYDHYKQDTARFILGDQGRYVLVNYYDRQDTLLDYTNTKENNIDDTVEVPVTRWIDCTHYNPDLSWSKPKFKYETKLLRNGWEYRIVLGNVLEREI